eukprot:1234952-Lingulodinium_polyedra.AAC.1
MGLDYQAFNERAAERKLEMRWVNGLAQLANSLTKPGEQRQLDLYYDLKHRWRITYDEAYESGRRRAAQGISPLEVVRAPTGQ